MFRTQGSHNSAPFFRHAGRGRGSREGDTYGPPRYHPSSTTEIWGTADQLSSSEKRRRRRRRQDNWWALSHNSPTGPLAPVPEFLPAPTSERAPNRLALPITVERFQSSGIVSRRSPAGSWAQVVAGPSQLQYQQARRGHPPSVPIPLPAPAANLSTPSDGWINSRPPIPSLNWVTPTFTVIGALERTWRPLPFAGPELDTWVDPTPISTDLLTTSPDPTNLVAIALHTSLLLDAFVRISPAPIDAVTTTQQSLLSTALTSLLAITRQLHIVADVGSLQEGGCVVCYARAADTVLVPCWHLALCEVGLLSMSAMGCTRTNC